MLTELAAGHQRAADKTEDGNVADRHDAMAAVLLEVLAGMPNVRAKPTDTAQQEKS
jgi:hypothetical protein